MTTGPARHDRSAGFTLVELLIALVLIAVITVLMFSGLRLGSRAWEGVETVSDRVADIRVAHNFIGRTLRQARAVELVFDGQPMLVFSGDAERIELVAPLSEHVGIPGLYVLRLTLEDAGDHPRLVLTRWLLHADVLAGGDDVPEWEPLMQASAIGDNSSPFDQDLAAGAFGRTVLLPQVAEFRLAYFGIAEGEQEPEWLDEWTDQPRLPLKVRLALSTPRQGWPESVIELAGQAVGGGRSGRSGTTFGAGGY
ncbi:prepilin-type N-terminal cleavage/methylation domain-containing protein [Thiohalocapsa marina]|uniref:Prepilin-type N-terminal cleavage/methylation domain-containing protein n=1 Tax=Thiohalocapsa marina TaxID=424902 RepID=A0A5M8FU04_9GAMM|nr:prepilin-type N-terminal cleavage/methylation domain-containing protein [Thiohalocapsa marina]KAA6187287.1 prepilin-type N-terminal cleavage/methylation domain-containing protein [Thiohalocapsa marina]